MTLSHAEAVELAMLHAMKYPVQVRQIGIDRWWLMIVGGYRLTGGALPHVSRPDFPSREAALEYAHSLGLEVEE